MESLQNTILIIEDDLGLNELICEKMTECGYKTHSALSALQANSWLSTNSPILMVVDYSLNDMTAKDFIVDMQEKGFVLPPFIIATGQGDERIAVEMMKLGARDYIIKDTNLLDLLPTVIGRVVKEVENELKLKRAQEELKESEEKFRILFADNPQPMFVYNLSTLSILEVNQTALNFYGYTKDECLKMTIKELHPSEDIQSFLDMMEQTKMGINTDGITRHIKKNGEVIIVEIFSAPANFLGENARLALVVDITERKKMEEAVKFLITCGITGSGEDFFESLAKYLSQILDMEYVCIDKLDADGLTAHTLANYNDGTFDSNISYTLHQTPCGEAVGKTICCFPENVCNLFPYDYMLRDMNAESYVGTTLWSFDGKAIGLIAIIGRKPLKNKTLAETILRLVSVRAAGELERKQVEDALRESEKMFSDMAINSAGVIYQFYARNDGSTGFYYLSPKVKEMFNFSDDLSSIEWRLGEYVHPDDKDFFLTNVANSISEVKELDVEARVLTSMGTKWIHFLSRPMKKNDEIVFNGIMIDVTERKELTISIQENEAKMKKVLVESSILIDVSSEVADYQKITNTIAEISGAKYVSFDIVNNTENVIQTYAISGVKENLLKISSMLGFDVVNKKWKNDPIRAERIKKQIVTRFNSINDITGAQIPLAISKVIEKTFNLGEVVIVIISKENETIAFFTLFFSKEKTLQNTDLLELFANQVSLFMERKKAEEALISKMNEMEYFQSITIGRELKMIELKKEINKLLNAAGKENKYIIVD